MFRYILYLILLAQFSLAGFQKVKIGTIDSYYSDKINEKQLIQILKSIENNFERNLGVNVFDYDVDGKPIDIIYTPLSKKKQNLQRLMNDITVKRVKIKNNKKSLLSKQNRMKILRKKLEKYSESLNEEVNLLNQYITTVNNKKITSQDEYNKIKKTINRSRKNIQKRTNSFNQKKIKYNTFSKSYNQQISLYNTLINQYNRMQRKVEIISRSIKEVKGAAIGYTQTTMKTFYLNGEKKQTKKTKNYMKKIEIYGFDNLKQLKAILAHELLHLVGVGHTNTKGSLMNPILQKNQIKRLKLTPNDIAKFREGF